MRIFIIMFSMGLCLMFFQNCGSSASTDSMFAEGSSLDSSLFNPDGSCVGSCSKPEELLWIQIRENEPYRVDLTVVTGTHFTVSGICGTGTFQRHSFVWSLREAFGSENIVGQGFRDDLCDIGHFQMPIIFNRAVVVAGQRYQVSLELVGLTSNNQPISNPRQVNKSSVDIIFE